MSLHGSGGSGGSGGGAAGAPGVAGKSAYQTWLDLGNTGTEADFIASLKGPKGDQGLQGLQGTPGTGGSGGGSGVFDINTFSATIPLTTAGQGYMPATNVTGPLTFAPAAGAVRGALVYLRLTANSSYQPDFSAFKEWGSSSGYNNTTGIVNQVQFFNDGADNWYSVSQAVGATPAAVPDTTAPTLTSPTSAASGPNTGTGSVSTNEATGILYYLASANATEALATVKAGSSKSVTASGVQNVSFSALSPSSTYYAHFVHRDAAGNDSTVANSGSFITSAAATAPGAPTIGAATAGDASASVAFTAPASNGGSAILDYTVTSSPGNITATGASSPINVTGLTNGTAYTFTVKARNSVDSSVASAASNSVMPAAAAAPVTGYLRLTTLDHATESGTGPFTYTINNAQGSFFNQGGVSSQVRPTGADASAIVINTNGVELIVGVTNAANAAFTAMDYAIWTGSAGFYTPVTGGSTGSATAVPKQAGDSIRPSFVGSTLVIEVARSATPTTWIPVYTFTSVSTASRKFAVNISANGNFQTSTSVGLV